MPDTLRAGLRAIGLDAFSKGFAAAGLLAAAIAAIACLLTFMSVRSDDTTPVPVPMDERPYKTIDCRDPL
jgi:hypothetical protein